MAGVKTGTSVDSPFTNAFRKGKPSLTEAPGSYNKHPNVGPAGVDGGLPLKFTDESIPTPKGKIAGPSMEVGKASVKSS